MIKKWIISLLSIIVIGYVGYQGFHSRTNTSEVIAQVRTAVVQKGTLEVKISGSGSVQPVTSEDIKSSVNKNEIKG